MNDFKKIFVIILAIGFILATALGSLYFSYLLDTNYPTTEIPSLVRVGGIILTVILGFLIGRALVRWVIAPRNKQDSKEWQRRSGIFLPTFIFYVFVVIFVLRYLFEGSELSKVLGSYSWTLAILAVPYFLFILWRFKQSTKIKV